MHNECPLIRAPTTPRNNPRPVCVCVYERVCECVCAEKGSALIIHVLGPDEEAPYEICMTARDEEMNDQQLDEVEEETTY